MRVIFVNIFLTIALVAILNLGSNILLVLYPVVVSHLSQSKSPSENQSDDWHVDLPNYAGNKDRARIYYQEKSIKKSQFEPYVGWKSNVQHGQAINIDDNGFRTHINHSGHGQSNPSVYFFGGSTMWGWGVWDNETIPALFNSLTRIPTYNMGEEGFVSRQGLERFINLLVQGAQIDTAIFYDFVNDVSMGCRVELKPGDYGRGTAVGEKAKPPSRVVNTVWQFLDYIFLSGIKELIDRIHHKISAVRVETNEENMDETLICDNSEERAKQVAMTLVKNWEIAHDLASARKIKFYAILHPSAHIGSPKVDHLKKYLNSPLQKELAKQQKAVYAIIQAIIKERQHKWILDYSEAFSRDEYIFIGAVHTSANGNQIIAERLYKDIMKDLSQ